MESLQVDWELCESTGELFAVLSPAELESPVDPRSVSDSLVSGGFGDFCMVDGAIDQVVGQIGQGAPGRVLVGQRLDAQVEISVSDDAMRATISTTPCYGGKALTEHRLRAALAAQNISYDICNPESIAQALSGEAVTNLPLAEGTPMERGHDSRFVPLVESVINVPLAEDATGRVNFREILEFTAVDPGTPLMRVESPSAGQNGADVYGRVIPAEPGEALTFPSSVQGATVDPQDPSLLVAEINGHPLVRDDCVEVDDVLTLDAVDVSTGNVAFGGSLLIKGDVASGSNIQATGDIVVKGIVDRATVRAGNDIDVGGGVFGEEVCEDDVCEFAAHLTAGGNIRAQFMSGVFASAARVVAVKEYIAHCNVNGKRGIHLGQEGGKGYIIGGKCRSDKEIVANVVGTDANVPTAVAVGYRSKLRRRYGDLKRQLSKLMDEQDAMRATLENEKTRGKTSSATRRNNRRIVNTLRLWDKTIARIGRDIVRARGRIDALEHARVVVKQELHPNTLLKINGQSLKIKAPRNYGGCYVCRGQAVQMVDEP